MRSSRTPIALLCVLAACGSTKVTPLPETPQAALHECGAYQEPDTRQPRYEPLPPAVAEAYQARSGCDCAGAAPRASGGHAVCGPFPCTPKGCHVARCRVDDDCRAGMCSRHASWPHGYCVTSDPK
jgi:hypothetical protein